MTSQCWIPDSEEPEADRIRPLRTITSARRIVVKLDEAIRQFLDTVGLEEIELRPSEAEAGASFRARATVPFKDGQIGNEVDVERLTWGTLPTGRYLRISALEIENRTDEELRVAIELRAVPMGVAAGDSEDHGREPERRRAGDGVDLGLGTWTW